VVLESVQSCPACGDPSEKVVAERLDEESAYLECEACGLQFLRPTPAGTPVFQDFAGYARALQAEVAAGSPVEETLTPGEKVMLSWLERDVPQGKAVLEVCCESGRFLLALRERAYRPYGTDPLESHVEAVRDGGLPAWLGVVEDVPEDWPQPAAVVLLESLVRFPDPAQVVGRIRERFPEAALYLSAPSARRSLKLPEFDRRLAYPPHHLTRWSKRSLERLLEGAGYRARCTTLKVSLNWPTRRGMFGNTLALVLRLTGEGEYAFLAVGRPR
jgi:hypothetical protein